MKNVTALQKNFAALQKIFTALQKNFTAARENVTAARVRRLIAVFAVWLSAIHAAAQIPYYAGTVGDGKLYTYTSLKSRPGLNHQETYTTFQYGLGDHWATGVDLYTGPDCAYWGALVRYGHKFCQWLNVGGEVISSFNLNDSFKYAYLTSGLYLNGSLSKNNRLFWCTNTWWVANRGADDTFSNYEYLGYNIPLRGGRSVTPMVGAVHSWKFDQDASMAAGFYYTVKTCSVFVWSNDLQMSHPRFVLGVEYIL